MTPSVTRKGKSFATAVHAGSGLSGLFRTFPVNCLTVRAEGLGYGTLPALIPTDASAMYARNLLHFFNLLVDPKTGALKLDRNDEIIAGALVCADGTLVRA